MRPVVTNALALFCVALASFSAFSQTPLVNYNDTWRWHKGNAPLQSNWKTVSDAGLDGTWFSSAGGFGYADNVNETNQCRTILGDMLNTYTTVYMRKQFEITNAVNATERLLLTMDFDDGFIAWLDGSYLTSVNVTGAPNEPGTNGIASASHESSRGNGSPPPPMTYDLGAVGSRLGIGTHTLAIIGLNQSSGSSDFIQIADLSVGTPGCPPNTICSDTNWTAANSPYVIPSSLTVPGGVTLTIDPGVTVLFNQGTGLTINGRLLAEGTAANPIVFTRNNGATSWSQLNFTANNTT